MTARKPITIWSRWNKKTGEYEHNHIEDGHAEGNNPVPQFPEQDGWKSSKWQKEHGHLDGMKVIK